MLNPKAVGNRKIEITTLTAIRNLREELKASALINKAKYHR